MLLSSRNREIVMLFWRIRHTVAVLVETVTTRRATAFVSGIDAD